ncbi:hypothetical protein [Yinghuangia soli]|uniref:Uncharacterized protein n=1 Tax=Yinghuangia soli TaxID=2908204 RepID=A0AA41U4A4_9ACTN|nr:hypothetical protein [Yinghuangia soli]MCF2528905.1 hypothetical protein [Yinghuangia soli]MCF2533563.1 hypothetical protein [Yinghuangia soli]
MPRITTSPTTKRSRRAHRVVGGLFGAAALAALSAIAAPTASAAPDPVPTTWDHRYIASGVTVYVKENGDVISVCDSAANGYSAWVDVAEPYGPGYQMTVTGGYGSCVTRSAGNGGVYDLQENVQIGLSFIGAAAGTGGYKTFINDNRVT